MGITKITFDVPDGARNGSFSNLAIVMPVQDSKESAQIEFLLMDKSGVDDEGRAYEEGVLQSRIIMSNDNLKSFFNQLKRYFDTLEDVQKDA